MKKAKLHKGFKRAAKILLGLLLLFLALVLFVRSPWGQDLIVDRVVAYASDRTGTEVRLDRLYLTFS